MRAGRGPVKRAETPLAGSRLSTLLQRSLGGCARLEREKCSKNVKNSEARPRTKAAQTVVRSAEAGL